MAADRGQRYSAGDPDSFHVDVRLSFGGDERGYDVTMWPSNMGATLAPPVRGFAKACAIADYLHEQYLPEWQADRARMEEAGARHRAEMEAKRPAREAAAKAKAVAAAVAPRVDAERCPDCGYLAVANTGEFDEPGYECNQCGSTGRGEEGRRCDQCHRFCARATDMSCPSCEAPLESVDTVVAAALDGELVEL